MSSLVSSVESITPPQRASCTMFLQILLLIKSSPSAKQYNFFTCNDNVHITVVGCNLPICVYGMPAGGTCVIVAQDRHVWMCVCVCTCVLCPVFTTFLTSLQATCLVRGQCPHTCTRLDFNNNYFVGWRVEGGGCGCELSTSNP